MRRGWLITHRHLDSFLTSCGKQVTSTATWNVHAEADNCCGGKDQSDCTIVLT
jgi:hypothetical protein